MINLVFVHVYVVIHFYLACGLFEVKGNGANFFLMICLYELPLDIKLSRGEGLNPINRFNSATFLCLSKARNGFPPSYVVVFLCSMSSVERGLFVDTVGIVDL